MGAERGSSRRAVTIGIGQFEGGYERLPYAPQLVTKLGSALAALGYETTTRAETKLTSAALGAEVREQLGATAADGLLIVHVLTHGQVADGDASVYLLGSDTKAHEDADVAEWLKSVQNIDGRPLTLFLLDLCQSGMAARLQWQPAPRKPLRGWVIAASRGDRPAYDGRFTRAVISVLRDLAAGGLGADPSVEHVSLDAVAKAIRREVNRLAAAEPRPPWALMLISGSLARVAGGEDGTITVQDDTSTQPLPGKHDGPVAAVTCQYLGDRPLAFSGGQDGQVRVWDLAARQLLDVIDVMEPVFAIEATGDGDLVVGAGGEAIAFRHVSSVPDRSSVARRRKPRSRLGNVFRGGQR